MGVISEWTPPLDRLVLERGPIEREELVTQVMPLVPPGVALRQAETNRAWTRNSHKHTGTRKATGPREIPDHISIEVGRRGIISGQVSQSLYSKRYIEFIRNGKSYISAGPNIVRGPTGRMARKLCAITHTRSEPCPSWSEHVLVAMQMYEAFVGQDEV